MKRMFDLLLVVAALPIAVPLAIGLGTFVRLTSRDTVLYWSQRVGRDNRLFWMPKFRTMRSDTPQLATHLLNDPHRWLTPLGGWLRATSLDELPQLWSILRGEMSFVGPRPALFNQDDLVAARTAVEVHRLTPGLTGWAQINGRDELSIAEKVRFDAEYARDVHIGWDAWILTLTIARVWKREGVGGAEWGVRSDRGTRNVLSR